MCTFNYIFISETTVKVGAVLDYTKRYFKFFVLPNYINERDRILETPCSPSQQCYWSGLQYYM